MTTFTRLATICRIEYVGLSCLYCCIPSLLTINNIICNAMHVFDCIVLPYCHSYMYYALLVKIYACCGLVTGPVVRPLYCDVLQLSESLSIYQAITGLTVFIGLRPTLVICCAVIKSLVCLIAGNKVQFNSSVLAAFLIR